MTIAAKIVAFASLGLLITGTARAEQAAAAPPADRCEGTLCDLYYSSKGNTADTTREAGERSGRGRPGRSHADHGTSSGTLLNGNPLSRWFGGSSSSADGGHTPDASDRGAAAASNSYMHLGSGGLLGDKQERCTGTLCDTYYGSSPAEPASAGPGQQRASATPVASAAEPVVAYRHIPHESETRPKCSSPARRSLALLPQIGDQRRGNAASNPRTRPRSRTESARSV